MVPRLRRRPRGAGPRPGERDGHSLRQVRIWLDSLSEGRVRLLGTHERAFAVVLTEHEFEVLCDGIPREVSEDPDVLAVQTMRTKIITQLRAEQRAFANERNKEVPF